MATANQNTTPEPLVAKPLAAVMTNMESVIKILTLAGATVPVIGQAVTTIVGIIKALKGTPPDPEALAKLIADIRQQTNTNTARYEKERERLLAILAAETAIEGVAKPSNGV